MGVATNPRPGRVYRALIAGQSAKGSAVSDFSLATQAWARVATVDLITEQIEPEWWMSYHNADFTRSRYKVTTVANGTLIGRASYGFLMPLLQSLYGTYSAPSFTLRGYVASWLSLGMVEDKTLANQSLRFVRATDAAIVSLVLDVDSNGYVDATARYAAENSASVTINQAFSGMGVTLPAAPMDDVDRAVFPGRSVTVVRDPATTPVTIPFERLALTFDVNVEESWDQMRRKTSVIRRGPMDVGLILQCKPGDEIWQTGLDASSGVKRPYEVRFTEPTGHAFTVRLYNVSFNLPEYGVYDLEYRPIVAQGMATLDASGNFVDLSLI